MAHRADHGNETNDGAVATHGQHAPRRRWWHALLPCRGYSQIPWVERSGHTDRPEQRSLEESCVLQRYHARNLAAARRATEDLVREGWHTGAIPYGYRPHRIRTTPAGRRPRYRTRLLIERVEASVVEVIFWWRVHHGLSVDEIVRCLHSARYLAPRRPGGIAPGLWTSAVVQAILGNPKYTGYQVWGRTRNGYPAPFEQWVWSGPSAHPRIIDAETFRAAQRLSSHAPHISTGRPDRASGIADAATRRRWSTNGNT